MSETKKNVPLLTESQMAEVAHLEDKFRTSVKSKWCRYPGKEDLDRVASILHVVTGRRHSVSVGCSTCIVDLMAELGRMYFATKEANVPKVASVPTTEEPRKEKVKTSKSGRNGNRKNQSK